MPSKSQSFCIKKMRKPIKKEKIPRWDFHGLIRSDYRCDTKILSFSGAS